MERSISGHAFPPSQPTPLDRRRKEPTEILTNAYKHVCDRFPALLAVEDQRDNVETRVLLLYARDLVLSEIVPELASPSPFERLIALTRSKQ